MQINHCVPYRFCRLRVGPFGAKKKPPRTLRYSTAFAPAQPDQVQVAVGSNGSIVLEYTFPASHGVLTNEGSIYHPPVPSGTTPAIIYLPRGPLVQKNIPPAPTSLNSLAVAANVTVVRLNYRLSKASKYPTPVHDVLAGYDWVARHIVRGGQYGTAHISGRVGVCGEAFGGGLAAMLAVTECRESRTGVKAAVLGNPISDWTAMHAVDDKLRAPPLEPAKGKKRARKESSWTAFAASSTLSAKELVNARSTFFRLQEDYFDPFASPLLFFRTPTSDVPPDIDPLDEIFLESHEIVRNVVKKRRSQRRYPPTSSSLRLPHCRVWVGEESVLRDQGIEFAESVARSISLYGGPNGTGEGEGWERVEVQVKDGTGFWGERELIEIGGWFGQILRSTSVV